MASLVNALLCPIPAHAMSLTHTIEASPPAAPTGEPKTRYERSSVADQQQKQKTPATDGYGGSVAGAVRRRRAGGLKRLSPAQ